jgi:predicted aspartyl protease
MLFDSGADRLFISSDFASLIGIEITKLNDSYDVELADGKIIEAKDVALDCVLNLDNHDFKIDLMPLELGSDLVVGMDWLAKNKAEIVCHEKSIRIPLENGERLIFKGDILERSCVSSRV